MTTLGDQQHGTEDGGRSTITSTVSKMGNQQRRRATLRNITPKMKDQQAPTTAYHTPRHPTQPMILPNPIENPRAKEPNPYPPAGADNRRSDARRRRC